MGDVDRLEELSSKGWWGESRASGGVLMPLNFVKWVEAFRRQVFGDDWVCCSGFQMACAMVWLDSGPAVAQLG